MQDKILKMLGRADYAPSNIPALLRLLKLKQDQLPELDQTLRRLEDKGLIILSKGNRYILAQEADLVPGVISINRQGKGFLQPDAAGSTEIVIPESATGTALNGDHVLVRLEKRGLPPRKGKAPASTPEATGTVIRILERKRSQLVGTLKRGKSLLFVVPDDPRIPCHIFVPEPRDVGRKPQMGDKVVVEILYWESKQTNPEGEIIEVLGPPDAEGVDMLSVLKNYDLPLSFPKEMLQEAVDITSSRSLTDASAEDMAGRTDCRDHMVITIDPDDAKDFDDAICVKRISPDKIKLWVHIADVSHYVRPGSKLDAEARKRGNSTYLVDRVIPMLPEALSNELCSLKPHVDRLTKCVEFSLTNDGAVTSAKFYPAAIRSQRRFTYQEVLQLLQQPPSADPIEQMVHAAHNLAQHIRKARFENGSLDLDFPENKIRLDEDGKVLRIERNENDVSHQLIEEFMLLANEAVAGRLMGLNRPAVYRVHEAPKAQRLMQYREDVLSHHIPCGNLSLRPEVQKLLERLGTIPAGGALKIGFLRSLMRARYAVEPLGHYGLAKTKYTHFTSPIRRYADLVVHRVLFEKNGAGAGAMKEIADHLSTTERNSADAERDSKEVKLQAFLRSQLETGNLQTYPAMVTDVRNFGFFVDVPTLGMSGLVHLSSLQNEFFTFNPGNSQLTGRPGGRVIKLGDKMDVQVWRVDPVKKLVDFQIAAENSEGSKPSRPARGNRDQNRPKHERPNKNGQPADRQRSRKESSSEPARKPASGKLPHKGRRPKKG